MNIKELLGDAYKEDMSVEDIEKALDEITIPKDNTAELEKLKTALNKSNSEAAQYKKQLKEKMTEDEQKQQREQEERAELQANYEKLLHESNVSKNKAKLLALGYEEKLADETAEAMTSGDLEKVIDNQKKHLEAFEKSLRSEILKDTPKPTADGASENVDLKTLRSMSPLERLKFAETNSDEYEALYESGGKE